MSGFYVLCVGRESSSLLCLFVKKKKKKVTKEQYPTMAKYIMDSIQVQLGEKGTEEVGKKSLITSKLTTML